MTETLIGLQSMQVEGCGIPHPRFPVKVGGFRELYAPFLKERRTRGLVQRNFQEIRGISRKTSEILGTLGFVAGPGCCSSICLFTKGLRGSLFAGLVQEGCVGNYDVLPFVIEDGVGRSDCRQDPVIACNFQVLADG